MKRCLFIDDSTVILKVAMRILSGSGMLAAGAESGRQALYQCDVEMPDIIVLDETLGDMTTAEFMLELKTIRADVKPRVMLCMVGFDFGVYMRARRVGVQGYLLKPFNRGQLINAFRDFESATAA